MSNQQNDIIKERYRDTLKVKLYFDLKDCRKENGLSIEDEVETICETHDLAEIGAMAKLLNIYVQKSVEPKGMPDVLNPEYLD